MNCKIAQLYIETISDNELTVGDSMMEVIDHVESCPGCKVKWELHEEIKAKLKHYVDSIKVPKNLLSNVHNKLYRKYNNRGLKTVLLVACVIFLIGFGLVLNDRFFFDHFTMFPTELHKVHNKANLQFISDDIEALSKHIGIKLMDSHFIAFKEAQFKLNGASRFPNRNIHLIRLKNNDGQKVSLCFLPKDYHLPNSIEKKINEVAFNFGKSKNCNIAFWKGNEKTIALVSDSLSHMEMINLAMPIILDKEV